MVRTRIPALALAAILTSSYVSPRIALASEQRAVYELRVNTVDTQHTIVAFQSGADVRVAKADLAFAGIRLPQTFESNADTYVSLSALGSILTYKIDEDNLILDVTVLSPQNLSTGTSVELYNASKMQTERPADSAFLNYSAGVDTSLGPTFAGEFGTHIGTGFFSTTFSTAARNANTSITNWIADDPDRARRITVGDVLAYSGDLGGGVTLAGVGVARDFGLNPNSYRSVLPGIAGSVTTPSTADIYVNGSFYKQITIQPGQFSFRDLPVNMGLNTTQIVITDAFGRQQTLSQNYYQTSALLSAGQTDYSYSVGKLLDNASYYAPAATGIAGLSRYAVGLTNRLTTGGRLEAAENFLSAGPEIAIRMPDGVLGLSAAASHSGAGSGDAALISYQRASRNTFLNISVDAQSPGYSSLGDTSSSLFGRALLDATAQFVLTTNDRDNYAISYSQRHYVEQGTFGEIQLSRYHFIGNNAGLQISAGYIRSGGRGALDIASSLQLLQGNNIANLRVENNGGDNTINATLERSNGNQYHSIGYQVGATETSGTTSTYGEAQYRTLTGDYFTTLSAGSGAYDGTLNAAGSIVAFGRRLFAAEPLYDSYALVDTNGIPGIEVTANGVDIGRTNKHGYLIVPDVGSYYDNRVQILPNNLPLNYDVVNAAQDIVPRYRAGNTIHFEVREEHPVFGRVVVDGVQNEIVPAYGLLEVDSAGEKTTSDIGQNGEFYLENATPGDHKATVTSKYGQCNFTIHIPTSHEQFLRIGTVHCKGAGQ